MTDPYYGNPAGVAYTDPYGVPVVDQVVMQPGMMAANPMMGVSNPMMVVSEPMVHMGLGAPAMAMQNPMIIDETVLDPNVVHVQQPQWY